MEEPKLNFKLTLTICDIPQNNKMKTHTHNLQDQFIGQQNEYIFKEEKKNKYLHNLKFETKNKT